MLDEGALEQEYLTASLRRAEFLRTPNGSRLANLEFDKLKQMLERGLRLLPDKGEAVLKRVSQNAEPYVQINAAAGLLSLDEGFAVRILEQAARGRGFAAITAATTLKEWRKGKLR